MCWVCEEAPKERSVNFISPIFKKGEKWNNENYTGLCPVHSE